MVDLDLGNQADVRDMTPPVPSFPIPHNSPAQLACLHLALKALWVFCRHFLQMLMRNSQMPTSRPKLVFCCPEQLGIIALFFLPTISQTPLSPHSLQLDLNGQEPAHSCNFSLACVSSQLPFTPPPHPRTHTHTHCLPPPLSTTPPNSHPASPSHFLPASHRPLSFFVVSLGVSRKQHFPPALTSTGHS